MNHPARHKLDRLAAGEHNLSDNAELRCHLTDCSECSEYLETLRAEQNELLERLPPRVLAARIGLSQSERRPGLFQRSPLTPAFMTGAGVLCAAVIAALLLTVLPETHPTEESAANKEPSSLRWRGAKAAVNIYLKREGSVSILKEPDFRNGDQLRYEVILPPGRGGFAALVALEEGEIFPVLPTSAAADPFPITSGTPLPGSVIVEKGGTLTRLMLFVRSESFEIDSLLSRIDTGLRQQKPPDVLEKLGLVHDLEVEVR